MLTLILGLTAALVCGACGYVGLKSGGWGVCIGMLAFFSVTVPLNLWLKKRMEALFAQVQKLIEEGQNSLRRKINLMQNRMASGGKGVQKQLEKEQADGVYTALAELDKAKPLYRWSMLAERQTNTVRAQLYYQIQEFDKADECFAKCLIMDPVTLAMRLARRYENGDTKGLDKAFRKGFKRYKDEKGVLLYALYSWILVKQEKIDEAIALLAKAKDATEDETLRRNWEHLVNGRVRHFSNAGLGDPWYALHMETPKPVKVRQRGPMGGGNRFR